MRAHSFKPKCKHPQIPEGKCSRTKPSGICLGHEAVAEANRYRKPGARNASSGYESIGQKKTLHNTRIKKEG